MKYIIFAFLMSVSSLAFAGKKPIPVIKVNPSTGYLPMNVSLSGSSSYDPDGTIVSYKWDFGDGTTATGTEVNHLFTVNRVENIKLTVTDNSGDSKTDSYVYKFLKDKTPPVISFDVPDDFTVRTSTPLITAFYEDETSQVQTSSVKFILDDVDVTNKAVISENHALLQFTSEFPLSAGFHTLRVYTSDYYGNVSSKRVTFKLQQQVTTNYLNGLIVDTNGTPVQGVQVLSASGPTKSQILATTDINGKFSAPFSTGGNYTLRISKVGYVEVLKPKFLVQGQDDYLDKVTLAVADTKVTYISAASGGIATNSSGSISIQVPPSSMPSDRSIGFTEAVTGKMLAVPLPGATQFTYAFDAQPSGTNFSEPATMVIDNTLGYPAGSKIPFGIGNEELGVWQDSGYKGIVSEDGQKIVFKVPHFSPGDVNDGAGPGPGDNTQEPVVTEQNAGGGDGTNGNGGSCAGSRIDATSCNLGIDYKMPVVVRRGKRFELTLSYSSLSANPQNIVTVGTGGQRDATPPTNVRQYVTVGGRAVEKNYNAEAGIKPSTLVQHWSPKNPLDIPLKTGSYPYRSEVANRYDNMFYAEPIYFGGPTLDIRPVKTREPVYLPEVIYGRSVVNNQINSPFGSGWDLNGWERLSKSSDGVVTLTDGTGAIKVYRPLTVQAGKAVVQKRVASGVSNLQYAKGVIYGADCDSNEVFRVDSKGRVTTLAGSSSDKVTQLNCPMSVFPSRRGGYYVADQGNRRIIYISANNKVKTLANMDKGNLSGPSFVTEDNVMAVHFIDGNEIKTVSPHDGKIITLVGEGAEAIFKYELKKPTQVHYDEYFNLIVLDEERGEIVKFYMQSKNIKVIMKVPGVKAMAYDNLLKRYFLLDNKGFVKHWQGYGYSKIHDLDMNGTVPKVLNPHTSLDKMKRVNAIAYSTENGLVTSTDNGLRMLALNFLDKNVNDVSYVSPASDFSTLTLKADGSFERLLVNKDLYKYNSKGFITQKIFPDGSSFNYEYTEDRLTKMTLPGGGSYLFAYDGRGYLNSITEPSGAVTSFAVDTRGDLTRITNQKLESFSYGYDLNHQMVEKNDPRNIPTHYDYLLGRVSRAVYAGGREKNVFNSLVSFVQNQLKMEEAPRLPTHEVITEIKWPNFATTQVIQDQFGAYRGYIDGKGNKTSIERDSNSKPILKVSPSGRKVSATFDELGRIIQQKGNITLNMSYDPLTQKVASIVNEANQTQSFEYTPDAQIKSYTDGRGNKTNFEYNQSGLVTSKTDSMQNTTSYSHDTFGNVNKVTDAMGFSVSMNRDTTGKVAEIIDPESNKTIFERDENGRVTSIIDAKNYVTILQYTPNGKIESLTDSRGNLTSFHYNDQDKISKIVDPKGGEESLVYDLNGNLTSRIAKSGDTIIFEYDEINNLVSKSYSGYQSNFEYDADKLLVRATTPDAVLNYSYDMKGRKIEEHQVRAQAIVNYGYNNISQKTTIKVNIADKVQVQMNKYYDAVGNVYKVQSRFGNKSLTVENNFDNANRLINIKNPNNTYTNITYDKNSRVSSILNIGTFGGFQSYRYSAGGNVTEVYDEYNQRPSIYRYKYDELNRLIQEDSIFFKSYHLDPLGNDLTAGAQYNELNQLIENNRFVYTYDLNGNLNRKESKVDDKVYVYEWSVDNTLRQVNIKSSTSNVSTISISYFYDAKGRRVERNVENFENPSKSYTQKFVYDGDNIIAILDASNNLITGYVHGTRIDDVQAIITDVNGDGQFEALSLIKDKAGSIRYIIDENQKLVQEVAYSAYGVPLIRNTSIGLINNNILYTGREFEPETGDYFYRARYYDPAIGRFLSEDPIGIKSNDPNFYRYAGNNPVIRTDPNGKNWGIIVAVVAVVAVAVYAGEIFDFSLETIFPTKDQPPEEDNNNDNNYNDPNSSSEEGGGMCPS